MTKAQPALLHRHLRLPLLAALTCILPAIFTVMSCNSGFSESGVRLGGVEGIDSLADDNPLVVATMVLPDGRAGAPYSTRITARGGNGDAKWSISDQGSLPLAATISPGGRLSWPRADEGSYGFAVRASEGGQSDQRYFTLHIRSTLTTPSPLRLSPGASIKSDQFATSPRCASCHSNGAAADAMRDAQGRPIAPFDLWQSTMMANSVRDPFFRAMVSAEIARTPKAKSAIEAKCFTCHAPMAVTQARILNEALPTLSSVSNDDEQAHLMLDGVSCTLCHQIQPDNLGQEASFSGGYQVNKKRHVYGPHSQPFANPMRNFSGFSPRHGEHLSESSLCATCHSLDTHALSPGGQPLGQTLPEQQPYLEWRNSVYSTEGDSENGQARSCQSCHMPTMDVDGKEITTAIARRPNGRDFPPIRQRSPFGRHLLVGGNTLIPAILRDNAGELSPQASTEAFNATIAAARDQLQRRTAELELSGVQRENDRLNFDVVITNLTGHKFPTGFPSRRAWLRVRVVDAGGQVIFRMGDFDRRGRLLGKDGLPRTEESVGGRPYPHREQVRTSEDLVVYESVMADIHGDPAYSLLAGASYLKDNRLLPRGWSPDHPDAAPTRPAGVGEDPDYQIGGSDKVHFSIEVPEDGVLTLQVELHYQVLSPRFAEELFRWQTRETLAFQRYYENADPTPVRVASQSRSLD